MNKIVKFIEKYWIYFILIIVGISLVIVAFNMLGINIIEWITRPKILTYIAIVTAGLIMLLTLYLARKFKK